MTMLGLFNIAADGLGREKFGLLGKGGDLVRDAVAAGMVGFDALMGLGESTNGWMSIVLSG